MKKRQVLPLGIGAAVYLTEYAQGSRLAAWVEFAAEILAGVPSSCPKLRVLHSRHV